MSGSFKIIDAQNLFIKNAQQNNEKFIEEMLTNKMEQEHLCNLLQENLKEAEPEILQYEETLGKYQTEME